MRALIVTNMYPTAARPALGSFVRDQVQELRRLPDLELELFAFAGGDRRAYLRAAATLRRRYRGDWFDIVHAHFGLTAWPALAVTARARAVTLHGTDLAHPRSRLITSAALPLLDLTAVVSEPLALELPRWLNRERVAVIPCGVEMGRFHPIARREARTVLGLDPDRAYLLFPADPRRAEKRYDRALAVAGDVPLLTLGGVDPDAVPYWINAANAVLVPSEREGFGLAVLEALACEVPVIATPTGISSTVLEGLDGAHCAPFDLASWRDAVAPHLEHPSPRLDGRARAEQFSAARMAARALAEWRRLR
ncbi:MAG: glycosyltransferase family 4 protein [Solirubrobacteraceae bacterium]